MKHIQFLSDDITPIGITNWRSQGKPFGIKDRDRLTHLYITGKSGSGKSTLISTMAVSDIERGLGIAIIDPHGELAKSLLDYVPKGRIPDVIYFNPQDAEFPIGFNPLKGIHPSHFHLVASGVISTFKKLWYESWGPRMEHILRYALLTLLEYRNASLLDIQPLLTNKDYREHILSKCINPDLFAFWHNEFDKYSPTLRTEAIAPILNKLSLLSANGLLRNIVGQKHRSFNMQDVMDEGKILICNLSKGTLGEDASALLGSMLITSIQLAALHRTKQPEHMRKSFYLYVDEVHSFISLSFTSILSESRKYGLSLIMAHQYIEQLPEAIRSAVFGNVGTMITFRVGAADAEYLAKEFAPVFTEIDLVNLPKYSMYLKLMIDGATSLPFSAITLPLGKSDELHKNECIVHSRAQYGRKRQSVEEEIRSRYNPKDRTSPSSLFSL